MSKLFRRSTSSSPVAEVLAHSRDSSLLTSSLSVSTNDNPIRSSSSPQRVGFYLRRDALNLRASRGMTRVRMIGFGFVGGPQLQSRVDRKSAASPRPRSSHTSWRMRRARRGLDVQRASCRAYRPESSTTSSAGRFLRVDANRSLGSTHARVPSRVSARAPSISSARARAKFAHCLRPTGKPCFAGLYFPRASWRTCRNDQSRSVSDCRRALACLLIEPYAASDRRSRELEPTTIRHSNGPAGLTIRCPPPAAFGYRLHQSPFCGQTIEKLSLTTCTAHERKAGL